MKGKVGMPRGLVIGSTAEEEEERLGIESLEIEPRSFAKVWDTMNSVP